MNWITTSSYKNLCEYQILQTREFFLWNPYVTAYNFFFQSSFTPSYLTQQTLYSSKTVSYNSHCSSNATLLKECSYLTVPVVWAKVMEYQHSATERASLTPLQQSAQGTTSTWRWSRPRHVNVGAFLFTKCISHKQKSCHFWKLCFGNSHVWDNSHKS